MGDDYQGKARCPKHIVSIVTNIDHSPDEIRSARKRHRLQPSLCRKW
jgi:hypothetical protein